MHGGLTVVMAGLVACGAPPATPPQPQPQPGIPAGRLTADSTASTLVPSGLGTLKQDDITIVLQPQGVRVNVIPLDESVIRVLAPDSYRALRSVVDSKRRTIEQRASMRGIHEPRVWYVRYTGLAPDARYVPTDVTVTSGGRDYRPFDVVPITPGFGEQRLQPRDAQYGLLLFEEGVDASQPLVVTIGSERNVDWDVQGILKKIDAERSSIQARAKRP